MTLGAETWTIIGTVLAVGVALATLIMRSTARLDADRRAFQAEAAADRRHSDAKMDAFRAEMNAFRNEFRNEMQRLAERQSHVEGALETSRSAAAAD